MQWMSLALVIVFGTLTLYLHDPRFVIAKFTIGKLAVGAVMLKPNWMSRYLPKIVSDTLSVAELPFYSAMWPVDDVRARPAPISMSALSWATSPGRWFLATVPVAAPWVLFALQYLAIRLHVRSIRRRRHERWVTA